MSKSKKLYSYHDSVIHNVHEWFIYNQNTYLSREEIQQMEPAEVLFYYLEWEGIYGYFNTIITILGATEYEQE